MKAKSTVTRLGWVLLLVALSLLYVGIATAGRWNQLPSYTQLYQQQAIAFQNFYPYLLVPPDPRLLALPNPYDPMQNAYYKIHDASLYHGRYYLYFGPLPALVSAVKGWITGTVLPDAELALAGFLLLLWVQGASVLHLIKSERSVVCWSRAGVGLLLVGLQAPVLFSLGRCAVYEASQVFGQLFLLCALLALRSVPRSGARSSWLAALGGLCAGCAIASRLALAPVALALCGLLALRQTSRARLALAGGLALPLFFLAMFNAVRFDSPLETGFRYQLSVRSHEFPSFQARFLPANVFDYALRTPHLCRAFPFVRADAPTLVEYRGNVPQRDAVDFLVGLLWSHPLPWLLLCLRGKPWLRQDELAVLALAFLAAVPDLFLVSATERNMLDFSPLLTWVCVSLVARSPHARLVVIALLLALGCGLLGAALGYTGYLEHFPLNNPELDRLLQRWTGGQIGVG